MGLVVMNSLGFCLSGNVLILPHFWRTILPDLGILVDRFFFLWAFWIYLSTFLWPAKFLVIKSTDNLIKDPLYVMICFSVAAFKILLFVFWKFGYDQSQCGSLNYSNLDFVELLGRLHFCLSSDLRGFQSLFVSDVLSALFSFSPLLLGFLQYFGPSHGVPWTS